MIIIWEKHSLIAVVLKNDESIRHAIQLIGNNSTKTVIVVTHLGINSTKKLPNAEEDKIPKKLKGLKKKTMSNEWYWCWSTLYSFDKMLVLHYYNIGWVVEKKKKQSDTYGTCVSPFFFLVAKVKHKYV